MTKNGRQSTSNSPIAVILDMDGTILDTERVAKRAWMQAAADLQLEFEESIYHGLIGLSGPDGRRYLMSQGWSEALIKSFEQVAWEHYRTTLDREGIPCKPGLFELLDFLDEKQIPRGVATSTETTSAKLRLDRVGALSRLDVVIGGDQVRYGKPAPDIYLKAASALGYDPENCVAIEDSRNGVKSAAAAGMAVMLVPDLCPLDDETHALASANAESLDLVVDFLAGRLLA